MHPSTYHQHPTPNLAELYPNLAPEQRQDTEANLRAYAALVWRICQRREHQPPP